MGILLRQKHPLQQLHLKKGGGRIFEGGLIFERLGTCNFMLLFQNMAVSPCCLLHAKWTSNLDNGTSLLKWHIHLLAECIKEASKYFEVHHVIYLRFACMSRKFGSKLYHIKPPTYLALAQ